MIYTWKYLDNEISIITIQPSRFANARKTGCGMIARSTDTLNRARPRGEKAQLGTAPPGDFIRSSFLDYRPATRRPYVPTTSPMWRVTRERSLCHHILAQLRDDNRLC